jgi:hypothetical protein
MKVPMLPMPMMCIRRVRSCSVGSSGGKFRVPELDDGVGSSGIGSAPSTPPHHDCWADIVRNGLQASRHSSILSWKHFAYARCVGNSALFRGAQKYLRDSLEVGGVRIGGCEGSVGREYLLGRNHNQKLYIEAVWFALCRENVACVQSSDGMLKSRI